VGETRKSLETRNLGTIIVPGSHIERIEISDKSMIELLMMGELH